VKDDGTRKDELENFHKVLMDVSMGLATDRVRQFVIQAYVKGMMSCGTADRCEFEGSTAVFTKRRFRDRWNRTIVKRLSKTRNHTLKIKARLRARGARGSNWYNDTKSEYIRKKARTQSLWFLHLAGDFHESLETEKPSPKPHLMRVMLGSPLRPAHQTFRHSDISQFRSKIDILAKFNQH